MTMRALLTPHPRRRTTLRVAANSATGIGVPITYGAQAPIHDAGAFFMPAFVRARTFAALRRAARESRKARRSVGRYANPVSPATLCAMQRAAVIQHTETANHE